MSLSLGVFGGGLLAMFSYRVLKDVVKRTFTLSMTRWGGFAMIALIALEGWYTLGPEARILEGPRRAIADEAVSEAAAKIPYDKTVSRVAVLGFERDATSYITDAIRSKIAATGHYIVCDKGAYARARQKLRLDPTEITNASDAIRAGKSAGVDAVVFGAVPEHFQDGKSAQIRMNVQMLRVSNGEQMANIEVKRLPSKSIISPEFLKAQIRGKSIIGRLVLWAMVIVALPLLLASLVRRVTQRDSNALNLVLLAALVFVNLLAALFIVGVELQTLTGAIVLIVILGLAVGYNYAVCTRIDELSR